VTSILTSVAEARAYDHVYIAPHLDDAVLSCGGAIARYVDARAAVLVVTLCAGSPPSNNLSPFAEYLHQAWALGDDPIAARRTEDLGALAVLGCDALQLDLLDAPYRVAAYGERDAVFATPIPDDPLGPAAIHVLQQLHIQQPRAIIYVPLGVGGHVDHQLVYAAGMTLHSQGANVRCYEDTPYAATWPNALEQRLTALNTQFESELVDVGATLVRKLHAISIYRSQLGELFGTASMDQVMTNYAATVAGHTGSYAERLWRPQAG